MRRIAIWTLASFVSTVAVVDELAAQPEPTAAQILEKNIAARGGLGAWQKIQTMVWIGHIETKNAPEAVLPFVLELKRPNKTRFEIKVQNQVAVRIYDGTHGWKLRQTHSGKPELQPYTLDELSFAHDGQGIGRPLMDSEAKGAAVTLDGIDEVEGHKAYRLDVKPASGTSHHVWIDAQTFLDIKYDRESRNAFGQSGTVSVFYRNYQTIEGLRIPLTIESGAGTAKATDKMVIDKILLNPRLEDRDFIKPNIPQQRNVVPIITAHPLPAPLETTEVPELAPVPGAGDAE